MIKIVTKRNMRTAFVKTMASRRKIISVFVTLIFVIATFFSQFNYSQAVFNKQINYQGKLTLSSGVAVSNGTYAMEFKLYTVDTGGTAIWTETRTGGDEVTVTNGLFSVMLGEVNPFTTENFNQTLYLGVKIEGDAEMTPRKKLGAVPASIEAEHSATATKSTNLVGGNSTTLLGSIPYQSNTDTTSFVNPNTTIVKKFFTMTGTGTNGAIPSWEGVTATDIGLGSVTNESKATMFTSPTFTGTVAGFTMGGNLVLGANTLTTSNTGLISNLNADLLDGQHGAYYATASSLGSYVPYTGATGNVNLGAFSLTASNLSGTNTGDNATNSQYSGLVTMTYPGAGIVLSTGSAWATSISGTSSQFVKGDGSLDSTAYVSGTPWTSLGYLTGITSDSPLSGAGTSTSHLIISQANTSTAGYLSSTDWTTFNGKQASLGFTPENVANKVTSISGSSTDVQYPSAKLLYDQLATKQAIGTYSTDIHSNITALNLVSGTNTGDNAINSLYSGLVSSQWTTSGSDIYNNNTGNVGIGTTNPTFPLEVNGDIKTGRITSSYGGYNTLTLNSDSYYSMIDFNNNNVQQGRIFGNANTLGLLGASQISLYTGGTEKVTVLTTGNVGIGTTAPISLLSNVDAITGDGIGIVSSQGLSWQIKDDSRYAAIFENAETNGYGYGVLIKAGGDKYEGRILLNVANNDNTSRFIVKANGNVGIGTTNPGSLLQVGADTANPGALAGKVRIFGSVSPITVGTEEVLNLSRPYSAGVSFGKYAAFKLGGYSGASDRKAQLDIALSETGDTPDVTVMSLRGNGNVGIGTTAPRSGLEISNAAAPQLIIYNPTAYAVGTKSELDFYHSATTPYVGTSHPYGGIGTVITGNITGDMYFWTRNGAADESEKMRIQSNGNVGIGTTEPTHKLSIGGSTTDTITAGYASIGIKQISTTDGLSIQSATNDDYLQLYHSGTATVLRSDYQATGAYTPLAFYTSGAEKVRIDINGNVGIGTVAPDYKLDIKGDANNDGVIKIASGNGVLGKGGELMFASTFGSLSGVGDVNARQSGRITVNGDGSNSAWQSFNMHFLLNTATSETPTWTDRMTILNNGNVGIGTTAPSTKLTVATANTVPHSWGTAALVSTDAMGIDKGGQLDFGAVFSGPSITWYSSIAGRKENATDGNFAGYLQFSTRNGASTSNDERMRIDSNGNVGIGTTGPTYPLDVNGNTRIGGTLYTGNILPNPAAGLAITLSTPASYFNIDNSHLILSADTPLTVRSNINNDSATYLQINGGTSGYTYFNGNVGIGTTAPGAKLELFGGYTSSGISPADNAIRFSVTNGGSNWGMGEIGGYINSNAGGAAGYPGGLVFRTKDPDGVADNDLRDRMVIDSNGNIGIGTTVPTTKLGIQTTSTDDTVVRGLSLFNLGGGTGAGAMLGLGYSDAIGGQVGIKGYYNGTGPVLGFFTNGDTADKVTINTLGNVGIGTTNPGTFKLQVAGNIGPDATNSYDLGAAGSSFGCLYYNSGTLGTCASDERLKTNITDVNFGTSSALTQVAGLRPRTFSFRSDKSADLYNGLIAQEVEQVAPELVVTNADGFKAVKYGDVQWLTLEALQELNLKVEDLSSLDTTSATSLGSLITSFLGDETARIGKIFAKTIDTENLCVSDDTGAKTCINKAQLDDLLASAGGAGSTGNGSASQQTATSGAGSEVPPSVEDNLAKAKTEAEVLTREIYTVESWGTFTTALATAQELPEENDADKIAKTTAINDAVSGLELLVVEEVLPPLTCELPEILYEDLCVTPVEESVSETPPAL